MNVYSRFLAVLIAISSCNANKNSAENRLLIPELVDSSENNHIDLVLRKRLHEFYPGIQSDTMGINSSYLGPTIRLYKGRNTTIRFINQIGEETTMHGHGLQVAGAIDGGPQSIIKPNTTWEIEIPVRQEAGMSWYHPHLMGKTAAHVHAGLTGIYLIEDENSRSLGLPDKYGVDDIPLVIQDRSFTNGKMNPYSMTPEQMMEGSREDTLVVNGTVSPYQIVPGAWVRLRLLNGSNARFYRFFFSNKQTFYKIATEGGFLDKPVPLQELTMAGGERNEIMIDLSDVASIHLMAEFLVASPGDQLFFMDWFNPTASVVELRVDSALSGKGILPDKLNDIRYYDVADKSRAILRKFTLEMDQEGDVITDIHSMFSINGHSMDMALINERVNKGQLEIWSINAQMMPHPFHIHGVSFQILSHQGQATAEADRGWKDTLVVGEEPTEVMMRFNYEATEDTPYMYHCHIFEHEDGGMMGQFTVQ